MTESGVSIILRRMARLRNRHHEAFAREIASLTPFATAYALAGYGGDPQWHKFNASKLAAKPHVRARIGELQAQFEEAGCIHAAYIQQKLLPLIEVNAKDLYEPRFDEAGKPAGHKLRAIADMPRDLAGAISKIKVDPETGAVTEISLHNKIEAGNILLRSVGGIVEKHQHEVSAIGARLAAALGRVGPGEQRQIAGAGEAKAAPVDDFEFENASDELLPV